MVIIGGLMQEHVPQNIEITLYKKLLKVMKKIEVIKKSGLNSHHGYQYSTEADFIEAVRQHLLDEDIIVLTSVEECSKEGSLTTVKTKHVFVDTENGQNHVVYSYGTGQDSQDKGVYKAITGAMKYFISKSFMIETQDDPESDGANTSYTKGNKSTNKSAKAAAPAKFKAPTLKTAKVEPAVEEVKEEAAPPKKEIPQPKAIKKPVFGKRLPTADNTEPAF